MQGDYIAVIPAHLVEWGERLGIVVDSRLAQKVIRQYLKHIVQTRSYKQEKRKDHEWRKKKRRQNKESAVRRKADRRGDSAED